MQNFSCNQFNFNPIKLAIYKTLGGFDGIYCSLLQNDKIWVMKQRNRIFDKMVA